MEFDDTDGIHLLQLFLFFFQSQKMLIRSMCVVLCLLNRVINYIFNDATWMA